MTEKVVWEKPPGCRLEWERGQRGQFGYKIRINADNFDEAFKEVTKAVGILTNFEKKIRADIWKPKEKK
jgi:hypothetical protein